MIRLPESLYYRIPDIKEYNRVRVEVGENNIKLNNQLIEPEKLEEITYKLTRKYGHKFIIIYEPDPDISFGRYIEVKDIFLSNLQKARNRYSLYLYNQPFDFWPSSEKYQAVTGKCPYNILEWTPEEKRLIELVKRAGKRKED